MKTQEN